jgi:hypothetical protein
MTPDGQAADEPTEDSHSDHVKQRAPDAREVGDPRHDRPTRQAGNPAHENHVIHGLMTNLDVSKLLQEIGVLSRPFLVLADVKPQDASPDDEVVALAQLLPFEHVMRFIISAELEHRFRGSDRDAQHLVWPQPLLRQGLR